MRESWHLIFPMVDIFHMVIRCFWVPSINTFPCQSCSGWLTRTYFIGPTLACGFLPFFPLIVRNGRCDVFASITFFLLFIILLTFCRLTPRRYLLCPYFLRQCHTDWMKELDILTMTRYNLSAPLLPYRSSSNWCKYGMLLFLVIVNTLFFIKFCQDCVHQRYVDQWAWRWWNPELLSAANICTNAQNWT